MPKEITVRASLGVKNGGYVNSRGGTSLQYDQATLGGGGPVQLVPVAYDAIDIGDVVTPGYVWLKNLDPLNFVEIGIEVAAAFEPFSMLEAGQEAVFPIALGAVLFAQADTDPIQLDVFVLEV